MTVGFDGEAIAKVVPIIAAALRARIGQVVTPELLSAIADEIGPEIAKLITVTS